MGQPSVEPVSPLQARRGRDLQRYTENKERLVAGCIPVRLVERKDGVRSLEVLLITSRNQNQGKRGLVLPKGGWETDESLEDAATRETLEEAGVRGSLWGRDPLGPFTFESKRSGSCKAYMFVMQVEEVLDEWPEQERERSWMSLDDAVRSCKWDWMKEALSNSNLIKLLDV